MGFPYFEEIKQVYSELTILDKGDFTANLIGVRVRETLVRQLG
jgi:hypothetical protein